MKKTIQIFIFMYSLAGYTATANWGDWRTNPSGSLGHHDVELLEKFLQNEVAEERAANYARQIYIQRENELNRAREKERQLQIQRKNEVALQKAAEERRLLEIENQADMAYAKAVQENILKEAAGENIPVIG